MELFKRESEMQQPDIPLQSGEAYRQLRAITIITFPLGIGLMLPLIIMNGLVFPAVGLIPMFFSTVLGSLMYTNKLRSPSTKASIDVALTVVYLALLMPR